MDTDVGDRNELWSFDGALVIKSMPVNLVTIVAKGLLVVFLRIDHSSAVGYL